MISRKNKNSPLTHDELDSNFQACMGLHNFFHAQDRKTLGTAGGAFTSGAWRTRELNTIIVNNIGAVLSSSIITLQPGTYFIIAKAPFYYAADGDLGAIKADLYSVTGAVTLAESQSYWGLSVANTAINGISHVEGVFSLGIQSDICVRHRSTVTYAAGFGSNSSLGEYELYTDVKIWKLS